MQMFRPRGVSVAAAMIFGVLVGRAGFSETSAAAAKGPYFARIVATTTIHSSYHCSQFECTVASAPLSQQPVSMDYVWQIDLKRGRWLSSSGYPMTVDTCGGALPFS